VLPTHLIEKNRICGARKKRSGKKQKKYRAKTKK
jgi:hypothetical protein